MKNFFETFKNIWSIKELRDKILFTIALLAVFRLGSFIVLPGVVPSVLENASNNSNSLFGLINKSSTII